MCAGGMPRPSVSVAVAHGRIGFLLPRLSLEAPSIYSLTRPRSAREDLVGRLRLHEPFGMGVGDADTVAARGLQLASTAIHVSRGCFSVKSFARNREFPGILSRCSPDCRLQTWTRIWKRGYVGTGLRGTDGSAWLQGGVRNGRILRSGLVSRGSDPIFLVDVSHPRAGPDGLVHRQARLCRRSLP